MAEDLALAADDCHSPALFRRRMGTERDDMICKNSDGPGRLPGRKGG